MLPLRPGCIIKAEIEDPNGYKKKRPAVIASEVAEYEHVLIVVFAITGKFSYPIPPKEILLPADPDGRLGTHVKKDCVVACWWPNVIRRSDIVQSYGKRPGLPGGRARGGWKTAAKGVTSSSRSLYFERRRSARRWSRRRAFSRDSSRR